jgi:hypothetical protein
MMSTQGSPKMAPSLSTWQLALPRQRADTAAVEVAAWQLLIWNDPQEPLGVPKLANTMEVMSCPGGQLSLTMPPSSA